MFNRIGSAAAVVLLATAGLAATAVPSEAAVLYPGRYNRVTNCYLAIIDKPALMTSGAFCKGVGNGEAYSIYKTVKGDKYYDGPSSRYNRAINCYKAIQASPDLRILKTYCWLSSGRYSMAHSEGPYTG